MERSVALAAASVSLSTALDGDPLPAVILPARPISTFWDTEAILIGRSALVARASHVRWIQPATTRVAVTTTAL
jgi:hypothetical protein